MRYLREVTLSFESKSEEDLNRITRMIRKLVMEELTDRNIKVRTTKNGFYPDKKEDFKSE